MRRPLYFLTLCLSFFWLSLAPAQAQTTPQSEVVEANRMRSVNAVSAHSSVVLQREDTPSDTFTSREEVASAMLRTLPSSDLTEESRSYASYGFDSSTSSPFQVNEDDNNRRIYYIIGGALVAGGLALGILLLDGDDDPGDGGGGIPGPPGRPQSQ